MIPMGEGWDTGRGAGSSGSISGIQCAQWTLETYFKVSESALPVTCKP